MTQTLDLKQDPNPISLDEQITKQRESIEHYKGVLARYQNGRWYDQGRRELQSRQDVLSELEEKRRQENILEPTSLGTIFRGTTSQRTTCLESDREPKPVGSVYLKPLYEEDKTITISPRGPLAEFRPAESKPAKPKSHP